MNPAPREAFVAGHNIAYTATYFDQVLFSARLANTGDPVALEHSNQMVTVLQKMGPKFADRMKHVKLIAEETGLPTRQLPSLPPDFYPWANLVHKDYLEIWKDVDPAGCMFAIGHALGEIRNGLIVLNLCIDFQQHLKLDCSKELQRMPPRLNEALQRWDTASQLIAEHPINQRCKALLTAISGKTQTVLGLLKDPDSGWKLLPGLLQKILPLLAKAEHDIVYSLPSIADRY